MDMHATDLVGINGITRVLLVYTCQQGVYPRDHILPLLLLLGNVISHIFRVCELSFGSGEIHVESGQIFNMRVCIRCESCCKGVAVERHLHCLCRLRRSLVIACIGHCVSVVSCLVSCMISL
jgi:hypothetical protein